MGGLCEQAARLTGASIRRSMVSSLLLQHAVRCMVHGWPSKGGQGTLAIADGEDSKSSKRRETTSSKSLLELQRASGEQLARS
jgi:hypothetical protein